MVSISANIRSQTINLVSGNPYGASRIEKNIFNFPRPREVPLSHQNVSLCSQNVDFLRKKWYILPQLRFCSIFGVQTAHLRSGNHYTSSRVDSESILSVFGEIMMVYGVQKFWTGSEINMSLDLGEYSELDNKLGIQEPLRSEQSRLARLLMTPDLGRHVFSDVFNKMVMDSGVRNFWTRYGLGSYTHQNRLQKFSTCISNQQISYQSNSDG